MLLQKVTKMTESYELEVSVHSLTLNNFDKEKILPSWLILVHSLFKESSFDEAQCS